MRKLLQDVSLGDNLRKLRLRRGFTQEKVAVELNLMGRDMSRSMYSQIETGKRNLYVSDLILLKIILKAQYSEFFEGLEPPEAEQEDHSQ